MVNQGEDREILRQQAVARMREGIHLGGPPYPNRRELCDRIEQKASGVGRFVLRQDFRDHMPMHVSQPTIDAVVAERQARVVDAQEVEDGGV